MQIKIDIGNVVGGCPDDICEVRGQVTPQSMVLLVIAKPKQGDYAGKVVVFNVGQAVVEVFDPEIAEHKELIEKIKTLPPASVSFSSIEDAEFVAPEPEKGKIIQAPSGIVTP
jgi:hypothetical protein